METGTTGRKLYTICSLILLAPLLSPARAADQDARLWASAEGKLFLGEEWSASLLLQDRFSDDITELERFLIRPSIDRRFGDAFALGVGYDAHLIRQPASATEHRIWQQASFRHDLVGIEAAHRLRLEERFIEDVSGVAARLRYGVRGTKSLFGSQWYAALGNEVFFNLNTRSRTLRGGFGEDRVFAGIGYRAAMGRIEAGYQLQYIDRHGTSDAANHALVFAFSVAGNHP
jgi:hypothetical protein